MPLRGWASRLLGHILLLALAVATVTVALQPNLWWFLLLFLGMLWFYGFFRCHAYVLAHGIGPRPR